MAENLSTVVDWFAQQSTDLVYIMDVAVVLGVTEVVDVLKRSESLQDMWIDE